jgi:hypothetical protein
MANYTLAAEPIRLEVVVQAATLVVTEASQLPDALKSKKQIVIDNTEIANRFSSLRGWQEARMWMISLCIAALLAYAISRDYKLEISWQKNWQIHTIDGKVMLTPIERNR